MHNIRLHCSTFRTNSNFTADVRVQETWYEKLQDWTEALRAYEKRQESNKDDVDLTLGRMRCLESLGEWGQLYEVRLEVAHGFSVILAFAWGCFVEAKKKPPKPKKDNNYC